MSHPLASNVNPSCLTRARGTVYFQILLFHARSESPQLAAQSAETWADLFKKRVDELALRGIEDTYKLVASKQFSRDIRGRQDRGSAPPEDNCPSLPPEPRPIREIFGRSPQNISLKSLRFRDILNLATSVSPFIFAVSC